MNLIYRFYRKIIVRNLKIKHNKLLHNISYNSLSREHFINQVIIILKTNKEYSYSNINTVPNESISVYVEWPISINKIVYSGFAINFKDLDERISNCKINNRKKLIDELCQ